MSEADQLRTVATQYRPTVMVGYQYVYNDHIRYLKAFLKTMAIGSIRSIAAEHLYPGPERDDVGCFVDAGSHELSILHYLFGFQKLINVRRKSVMTSGGRDADTTVAFQLANGPSVSIRTSWRAPVKTRIMTLYGQHHTIVFDDTLPQGKLKIVPADASYPIEQELHAREPLANELDHFIHCVRTGNQPITDIAFGYEITAWLDDIMRHNSTGQPGFNNGPQNEKPMAP